MSVVLFMFISVLMGVNFFVLLERKLLGFVQFRKGPEKSFLYGLIHSFSDAMKLFKKTYCIPFFSNFFMFYIFSFMTIYISLIFWLIFPYFGEVFFYNNLLFIYFSILSMGVFPYVYTSWSSNSKYSFLASMRIVAQVVSYDISFIIIIISLFYFLNSLSFFLIIFFQICFWNLFMFFLILYVLFLNFLAELHRIPFDFSESESELVSGFNVEYGGLLFTYMFLSEYMNIIYLMSLMIIFSFGFNMCFTLFFFVVFLLIFLIIIRGSLPRYRYDKLMVFCWFNILPLSIIFLFIVCVLIFFFIN
uniref:NADH dehydrogenase subunit 1 n=1 Tax=Parasacculina yatsui TaxID=2836420 RepID=UPI002551E224|nr:NADH dehydrogenase subunit 1 [Parasacculina yatsui]WGU20850.1 NADH dehydrogenase subunit 1 [Parasacculina yatsui]